MVDKEVLVDELCSYYDDIGDYIEFMGVDKANIEDVLNDVFEDAYKAVRKNKGPADGKMLPWLRAIARNKAKRYFRKRYRHRELFKMAESELSGMVDIENVGDDETVESVLLKAEEKEILGMLLDGLPETARKIVIMHAWGEDTFNEIADVLDANLNTVKSLYYRSFDMMKKNYFELTGEEERHD